MTKRFNPWYWLAVIAFVSLCFIAWNNPFSRWAWVFTFVTPPSLAVWVAYVYVVADNFIKPDIDFPPFVYYVLHVLVAVGFYLFWFSPSRIPSTLFYGLLYVVIAVTFDIWDIFRTEAQKKKLLEKQNENS